MGTSSSSTAAPDLTQLARELQVVVSCSEDEKNRYITRSEARGFTLADDMYHTTLNKIARPAEDARLMQGLLTKLEGGTEHQPGRLAAGHTCTCGETARPRVLLPAGALRVSPYQGLNINCTLSLPACVRECMQASRRPVAQASLAHACTLHAGPSHGWSLTIRCEWGYVLCGALNRILPWQVGQP